MIDADMSKELPQTAGNPRHGQIAERWLSIKGVKKPATGSLEQVLTKLEGFVQPQTPLSIPEIYDLFVEREDLQNNIANRTHKTDSPEAALSLEKKAALISQGGIKTFFSSPGSSDLTGDIAAKSTVRIDEISETLNAEFEKPGVYEAVQKDLANQVAIRHRAQEVGYLSKFADRSREQVLKLARDAQVAGRSLTSAEEATVVEYRTLNKAAHERIQELMQDEQIWLQVRLMEMKRYRKELLGDGFVETQSRKQYIKELEELWSQGKKPLVTGPTGTGKTRLIRHASMAMFGVEPYRIQGHEKMTPYEILGRTGMTKGQDVYRPSKLVAAMIANNGKGAPFVYDEMDASPNQANIVLNGIMVNSYG